MDDRVVTDREPEKPETLPTAQDNPNVTALTATGKTDQGKHTAQHDRETMRRRLDRLVAELRRGDPVLVTQAGQEQTGVPEAEPPLLVLAADVVLTEAAERLPDSFSALTHGPTAIVCSARRAAALGLITPESEAEALPPTCAVTLHSPALQNIDGLHRFLAPETDAVDLLGLSWTLQTHPGPSREAAILALMRRARLLPAAVIAPATALEDPDPAQSPPMLDAATILKGVELGWLIQAGDAKVPLEGAEEARIIAFRPSDGGHEHLAIVIGDPDPNQPVLARIHSECFTGDLLSSLRCDCGSQLRGAIAAISAAGSGVLLYLAQEGRGIGLINKLHAYRLQDQGLDTVEANQHLGFEPDERAFRPAAEMLEALGISRVRLMTNNPRKIAELEREGVTVTERVPHHFEGNGHNEAYLRTKAAKFGHLF